MKRIPVFLTLILLSVATMAQQRLTFDTILFKRGGKLYKLILYGDSLIINQTKYYTLPGFGSTAQYLRGDRTWQNLPTISPADTNLWVKNGTKIFNKNQTGYVGVNTTNPIYPLHVNGITRTTNLHLPGLSKVYVPTRTLVLSTNDNINVHYAKYYDPKVVTVKNWKCGDSITVTHTAGAVAPVTKTVTYKTVDNLLGEPLKCWITQNLGATNEASSSTDASEESAGWYWQFNRKQGYKHDGTNRTPNSTWITSIDENSDLSISNDPCAIELGQGWHIPTMSEWSNVSNAGSWANRTTTYNSPIKLHAAGLLWFTDGSLLYRGSSGSYMSNNQYSNTHQNYLYFTINNCYSTGSLVKTHGLPTRCISSPLGPLSSIDTIDHVDPIVVSSKNATTVQIELNPDTLDAWRSRMYTSIPFPDTSWNKSLSGVYSMEMISIGDSVPSDSALNVAGGVNVTGGLKVSGQVQSDYRLRLDQGLSVGTSNSDAALNIGYGGIRIDGPLELDEKPTYLWALDPQGYLKTTPLDSVSNPTDTSHLSSRIDQKLSIADSNQYATPYDLSQIRSSQWTTSGDHLYYTTGMVGIGITNPSYSIHSSGDIMANGVRFGQGSYAGNNTCFGTGTLGVNQSGTYNLALGAGSMGQLDAGSYNVGVGPSTLYNIYNGNGNTALGVRALYNQSGGDTTIGIGFEAGRYNVSGGITDASNSIYIGGNTKGSGFYPLNEIAIGHDARGNGNNTITLGHTTITKTFLRGSVVYNPSNTGNITAATGITAAMLSADMRYTGDSGIDITANPQIADGTDGQQISIVGLSDSNTLTLDDGDGLSLSAQVILGAGDVITLRYIASLDKWIEISRSNN